MTTDLLFGILRLAHALSAALWIGGTFAFLIVSGPATERLNGRPLREALRLAIGVFVLTGGIMAVQRLGAVSLPPTYFAVLLVKVGLGIWLFSLGRQVGTGADATRIWWRRPEGRIVISGVAIYGLAMVLRVIYESALRG